MKNKKLIVNADDFGLTPGVTQGIIEAHKNGIVTSTTALTVSDYFLQAMEAARIQAPNLSIGLHLTLTLNKNRPILPKEIVPSLVDENGYFWNQNIFHEKVDLDEVSLEWEAQILKFLESGQKPTHIDSHHNVHGKTKDLLEIALKLARKFNLPVRNNFRGNGMFDPSVNYGETPTTDEMIGLFYGEQVTFDQLLSIFNGIEKNEYTVFEMNCHPAFLDKILMETSSYNTKRIEELHLLTSTKVKAAIQERNILLTSYEFLS